VARDVRSIRQRKSAGSGPSELHGVLLASLTPGSVQWGQRVSAVTDGSVELEDGSLIAGADLIIGADGNTQSSPGELAAGPWNTAQRLRRVARDHLWSGAHRSRRRDMGRWRAI
jgi:hypothetical protein